MSDDYLQQLKHIQVQKQLTAEKKKVNQIGKNLEDSDETFAFIAGYTENGVPFGVRWEE